MADRDPQQKKNQTTQAAAAAAGAQQNPAPDETQQALDILHNWHTTHLDGFSTPNLTALTRFVSENLSITDGKNLLRNLVEQRRYEDAHALHCALINTAFGSTRRFENDEALLTTSQSDTPNLHYQHPADEHGMFSTLIIMALGVNYLQLMANDELDMETIIVDYTSNKNTPQARFNQSIALSVLSLRTRMLKIAREITDDREAETQLILIITSVSMNLFTKFVNCIHLGEFFTELLTQLLVSKSSRALQALCFSCFSRDAHESNVHTLSTFLDSNKIQIQHLLGDEIYELLVENIQKQQRPDKPTQHKQKFKLPKTPEDWANDPNYRQIFKTNIESYALGRAEDVFFDSIPTKQLAETQRWLRDILDVYFPYQEAALAAGHSVIVHAVRNNKLDIANFFYTEMVSCLLKNPKAGLALELIKPVVGIYHDTTSIICTPYIFYPRDTPDSVLGRKVILHFGASFLYLISTGELKIIEVGGPLLCRNAHFLVHAYARQLKELSACESTNADTMTMLDNFLFSPPINTLLACAEELNFINYLDALLVNLLTKNKQAERLLRLLQHIADHAHKKYSVVADKFLTIHKVKCQQLLGETAYNSIHQTLKTKADEYSAQQDKIRAAVEAKRKQNETAQKNKGVAQEFAIQHGELTKTFDAIIAKNVFTQDETRSFEERRAALRKTISSAICYLLDSPVVITENQNIEDLLGELHNLVDEMQQLCDAKIATEKELADKKAAELATHKAELQAEYDTLPTDDRLKELRRQFAAQFNAIEIPDDEASQNARVILDNMFELLTPTSDKSTTKSGQAETRSHSHVTPQQLAQQRAREERRDARIAKRVAACAAIQLPGDEQTTVAKQVETCEATQLPELNLQVNWNPELDEKYAAPSPTLFTPAPIGHKKTNSPSSSNVCTQLFAF